jgi:hypothetical protein
MQHVLSFPLVCSLSAELVASLSQRDKHLHEQSVRTKLVESMVQGAMTAPKQQRSTSTSSTGSQSDMPRASRNLIIPYQQETSSKCLVTCEGIFRMLDAWQQQDEAKLAMLQGKHLAQLV